MLDPPVEKMQEHAIAVQIKTDVMPGVQIFLAGGMVKRRQMTPLMHQVVVVFRCPAFANH